MLYLDTSLLVASVARQAATRRVQVWLGRQPPETLLISDWVVTELASASSIKVHSGELSAADQARLAAVFTRLRTESLSVLPINRDHFATAARFFEQISLSLRTADALHLAVAADQGARRCTLERRLAEAATTAVCRNKSMKAESAGAFSVRPANDAASECIDDNATLTKPCKVAT